MTPFSLPIATMDSDIGRKRLPHDLPMNARIGPEEEVFFITICCLPRGINQLACADGWRILNESLALRELHREIHVRVVLAMPDHLHGLFSFYGVKPMQRVMADLKSWVAKSVGVKWQRDFFEHRVRGWESAVEKANYIRNNPVRAKLVSRTEDWPYQR